MYWITGILGAVLAVAPFVLSYQDHTGAMWTSIVLGLVVVVASIYEGMDQEKAKWEYWVAGLAGLVAVIAPFILGFSAVTTAMWTTVVLGASMLVLAGYELFFVHPSPR